MVSIIIATYNRKDMLLRCLASLNSQEFKSFEVIIVDDCSLEKVEFYLEPNNYFYSVNLVRNVENLGRAISRNVGVSNSTFEYILFTDDDCVFEKDYIFQMNQSMVDAKNNIAGFAGVTKAISKNFFNKYYEARRFGMPISVSDDGIVDSIVTANCILKKEVFNKVNGFDEKLNIGGEDSDLYLRVKNEGFNFKMCHDAFLYHEFPIGIGKLISMAVRYGRSSFSISQTVSLYSKEETKTSTSSWFSQNYTLFINNNVPLLFGFLLNFVWKAAFQMGFYYQKVSSK